MFGSSQPPSNQKPQQSSPQQQFQNTQQFPPSFPTIQPLQSGQNGVFNQGAATQPPAASFIDTTFQPTQYASPQDASQSAQNFFSPPGQNQPTGGPNIMAVNQPEGTSLLKD